MPTNSAQTLYENQRYELIKQLEEGGHENPEVYLDGAGIPTMGVGFNNIDTHNYCSVYLNQCGKGSAGFVVLVSFASLLF